MLEKLALLKMALCSARAVTMDSSVWWCAEVACAGAEVESAWRSDFDLEMAYPDSIAHCGRSVLLGVGGH